MMQYSCTASLHTTHTTNTHITMIPLALAFGARYALRNGSTCVTTAHQGGPWGTSFFFVKDCP